MNDGPVYHHETFIVRFDIRDVPGKLGELIACVSHAQGQVKSVDLVRVCRGYITRDIAINVADENHFHGIIREIKKLEGIKIINISDSVILAHLGGKLQITGKKPIKTRYDLSMMYTPGVVKVVEEIRLDPRAAFTLTMKGNTIAVVTDGTRVLGCGDVGPAAALPVMEGKAQIFFEFAGIYAMPICLATKDPDEIVRTVKYIAPGFGGINLEDIESPKCFDITERLAADLDIPVFHDDQDGTAVSVLGALINALKLVTRRLDASKVVVSGVGAAGTATTKLLLKAGAQNIIGCDRAGTLYAGRTEHMNHTKQWYTEYTNPERIRGTVSDALTGAHVLIGLSGPGIITREDIQRMAPDPIVFLLANPVPEIMPEEILGLARIIATGRSDYPNQVNNALVFPGIFRGALDCRASEINDEMKLAAAHAIAAIVSRRELREEYIVPSIFDRRVVKNVARAVIDAARRTGVAQRRERPPHY